MTQAHRLAAGGAAVLVLLAAFAVLAFSPTESSADSTFTPVTTLKLCNAMDANFPDVELAGNPACTENKQTGSATDVTVSVSLPPSDVHLSRAVTFSPSASTIASGNSFPAGTKVGGLRSLTTVGVGNGACNTAFVVDFVLYNVGLPNNPGNPRASTNLIYPMPEGTTNRFSHWQVGSEPPAGSPANVNDANADLRADGNEEAILNYPKYLLDVFDPDFVPGGSDGPAQPLVPKAVYGGLTSVLGNWIPLYFVQFDAGALTALPGPFSLMTAAMGHPSVAVLGDPTATMAAAGSPASDICTPVNTTTVLLGRDPTNTHTRATSPTCTSPATQCTHFMVQYLASQRDLDQDGFENSLDTCPKHVNTGSPKTGTGDSDGDGIDDSCDSTTSPGDFDEDDDGTPNRQDNCPLDPGGGSEAEAQAPPANDRGTDTDQLGDPCDTGTVTVTQNGRTFNITLSPTVANGRYHVVVNHVPKCYGPTPAGGTDADGDGYCTGQDNGDSGNCGFTNACFYRHVAWSAANAPPLMLGLDSDGDTWKDAQETYTGTDPTKSCAFDAIGNNESPLDYWPMDLNDDGRANTADVGPYVSRLGHIVNQPPASVRYDLNFDGIINTTDVGRFVSVLNKACGNLPNPVSPPIPPWSQQ